MNVGKYKKHITILFFIILSLGILFYRCTSNEKIQKQTRFLMDTYCSIQVPGNEEVLKTIDKAFARMEEIDIALNALDTASLFYQFNQEGTPISDPEIVDLINAGLEISQESDGAFDITVYPLINLWGFYGDHPTLPQKEDIDASLKNVGYRYLTNINGILNKKNKNTKIDLGGIAKGYAIQEALNVLKEEGISSCLIDAGGDIYVMGELNNKPWKVGIQNPRGEGVIGVLEISDLAVVTSGDYERFFEEDNVRYHHLLDPHTGYPARGLASVTVISSDPTKADAWATAIFILGKDKGMELVEKIPDLEALIITDNEEIFKSSGL